MYPPSIYAHIMSGMLLFVAFALLWKHSSFVYKMDPYKSIVLTILFSIAVCVHGLSHLGLEMHYNFNPFLMRVMRN
jgi:uncharacterized membrane protein